MKDRTAKKTVLAACSAAAWLSLVAPALAFDAHGSARVGLGYDSNPLLAPREEYLDPTRGVAAGQGLIVDPERHPGFFIPVALTGALRTERHDQTRLGLDLRAEGNKYLTHDTKNADNYQGELGLWAEHRFREVEKRWSRVRFGPSIAYNREIFVDPDTGEVQKVGDRSIADRLNYWRAALETTLEFPLPGSLDFDVEAQVARYDYEEVEGLDSFDNNYYAAGVALSGPVFEGTRLRLGYTYSVRDYEERRARNREGDLVQGEERFYRYHKVDAVLRHRPIRSVTLTADYSRIWRIDEFVGYDDYTRDRYRLRAAYADRQERSLRLSLSYWQRRYPRGFIFDVTPAELAAESIAGFTAKRKRYTAWEADLTGEVPFSGPWKGWTTYEFADENARDPRFDYVRHQISAGVKLTF